MRRILESLCCDLVVFLTVTTSSCGIPHHLGVVSEVTGLEAGGHSQEPQSGPAPLGYSPVALGSITAS